MEGCKSGPALDCRASDSRVLIGDICSKGACTCCAFQLLYILLDCASRIPGLLMALTARYLPIF